MFKLRKYKDVPGYEKLYFATEYGEIIRRAETYINNLGKKCNRKERLLKQRKRNNRYIVTLCKDGVKKDFDVARLIATTFIPNPNTLPFVNHKDENPLNNNINNLEWCTNSYNQLYGTCPERKAYNQPFRKPVTEVINDTLKIVYESARYAESLGIGKHSNIGKCCCSKIGYNTIRGHKWYYSTASEIILLNNSGLRKIEIETKR